MEESKLVHLTSLYDVMEANLLKSKLEYEGIKCFIFDENTVNVNPLYSTAMGGVRVMVSNIDANEALIVLENFKPGAAGIMICPHCSSTDIAIKQRLTNYLLALLQATFSSVQSSNLKPRCTCNDCGHNWK